MLHVFLNWFALLPWHNPGTLKDVPELHPVHASSNQFPFPNPNGSPEDPLRVRVGYGSVLTIDNFASDKRVKLLFEAAGSFNAVPSPSSA